MFVTIGIPFFNAELYLIDAIKSVFAQTHQDWELILMDDGSTDSSLAIAKSIKDPRVSVYSDGENKKLATRLNEITKLAKYDFIARMDADDLMSPTRIEKQLECLKNNDKLDLVTTGLFSVTDALKPISFRVYKKTTVTHDELLYSNVVVHAAILAKKQWFMRNPYDTSLKVAQDYNLWLKSSFNNDFNLCFIREPLYYYREEGNVSLNKSWLAGKYGREMFRKYGGNRKYVLILRSYLKNIISAGLMILNFNHLLLKRRGVQIEDEKLLERYNSEIKLIKAINLKFKKS